MTNYFKFFNFLELQLASLILLIFYPSFYFFSFFSLSLSLSLASSLPHSFSLASSPCSLFLSLSLASSLPHSFSLASSPCSLSLSPSLSRFLSTSLFLSCFLSLLSFSFSLTLSLLSPPLFTSISPQPPLSSTNTIFFSFPITISLLYFVPMRLLSIASQWSLRFRQVEKGEEGEGKVLKKDFEKSLLHIAISPFQFFISSVCFSRLFIFTLAKLKIKILRISSKQLYAVSFVLSLIWFFLKWKEIVFEDLSKKRPNELPQLHMFERVATLCIMSIGFITTAEVCGVKVKALFAIGGISGVAIGLAAKELVSNFFGGLMLYATRPFLVGDNIKTVSFSGEVQDIGFFQTQILGKDKSPMTVPNQFFTNMLITNLSKSKFVVLEATFQLRHQDILLVDRISIKIVEMLKSHPSIDPTGTPMAYLQCMTSSSLEFYMRINLKKMPANEYYRVQQEIIVKAAQIMIQQGAALGSSAPFDPTVPDFQ